jgi:hypothetical protein
VRSNFTLCSRVVISLGSFAASLAVSRLQHLGLQLSGIRCLLRPSPRRRVHLFLKYGLSLTPGLTLAATLRLGLWFVVEEAVGAVLRCSHLARLQHRLSK